MNSNPIVTLFGKAGSGKSTVASLIHANVPNTNIIAFSDPIKELGYSLFGFSDDQLYGPSEKRNVIDQRYNFRAMWDKVEQAAPAMGLAWIEKYNILMKEPNDAFGPYDGESQIFAKWLRDLEAQTIGSGVGLSPRMFLQSLGTDFGRKLDNALWTVIAFNRADELLSKGANLVIISDGRFRSEMIEGRGQFVLIDKPVANQSFSNHVSETELDGIPHFWFDTVLKNDGDLTSLQKKVRVLCNSLEPEVL